MIDAKKFLYDPNTKTFSIGISGYVLCGFGMPSTEVRILSDRTSNIAVFSHSNTTRDNDGPAISGGTILYWDYKCTSHTELGLKLRIFNDYTTQTGWQFPPKII